MPEQCGVLQQAVDVQGLGFRPARSKANAVSASQFVPGARRIRTLGWDIGIGFAVACGRRNVGVFGVQTTQSNPSAAIAPAVACVGGFSSSAFPWERENRAVLGAGFFWKVY